MACTEPSTCASGLRSCAEYIGSTAMNIVGSCDVPGEQHGS